MSKFGTMLMAAVVVGFHSHASAVTLFRANLTPEQVIPTGMGVSPAGEPARGTATLRLNDAMTELSYRIQLFNVDVGANVDFAGLALTPDTADDINAIHIHTAPAGSNGPHVLNIFGEPGLSTNLNDNDGDVSITAVGNTVLITGLWTDTDAIGDQNAGGPTKFLSSSLDDLFAGNLYFQMHSTLFTSPDGTGILRGQINPVPEPVTATLGLMGLGVLGMATRRRAA